MIDELSTNGYTNYRIAKETKITESSIGNYVNKKTKPSFANAKILLETYKPRGNELKEFSFTPSMNENERLKEENKELLIKNVQQDSEITRLENLLMKEGVDYKQSAS